MTPPHGLILLLLGTFSTLLGAYLMVTHHPGAYPWLLIGQAASVAYWITALFGVMRSRRLEGTERGLWLVGLLAAPWLTGWLYFFAWRRGRFA
jgi:hypothetical protein